MMFTDPAEAISAAEIVAVSCVALIGVVGRALPPQRIWSVGLKFEPLTVSVKPGSPAYAELGESVPSTGTGSVGEIVNARVLEIPPPGAVS